MIDLMELSNDITRFLNEDQYLGSKRFYIIRVLWTISHSETTPT
jgi:hypothetical protein